MTDTIPNTARVGRIQYTPEYAVICSVGKEPFHGTIEITYAPGERLLEFASFEAWLSTFARQEMTIEDLARVTFDELTRVLGDIPLRVTVNARTTVHAPVSATIERGNSE